MSPERNGGRREERGERERGGGWREGEEEMEGRGRRRWKGEGREVDVHCETPETTLPPLTLLPSYLQEETP